MGRNVSVTKGFFDHFGPERVRDTPIAEAVIVGAAIGAALSGLRPFAELMTINFAFSAMDHIVNEATFLPSYRTTYRYYHRVHVSAAGIVAIFRISTPVSLQNLMILLGFLVFVAITGIIGTAEQAASQVVTTALFMSFLPCFGFGIGVQTLVGQSLGRGDRAMAWRYGVEGARLATSFTAVLGAVFILLPDLVIGEEVTFQIVVTLPEGQAVPLVVTDNLPTVRLARWR